MGCCFGKSEEELPPAFDPVIGLCSKHKGSGVIVEGPQLSGTGSIFGDSPILQDKAYFEVTLVKPGTFAVGVCSQRDTPLDSVLSSGSAASAWTLTNNSSVPLAAGETIGIAFDQADYPVQLYFYKEGKVVHQLSGIRGEVLPVFSVADGAVLEPNFGGKPYSQGMPAGFQGIIKSMSLL